MSLVTVSFFFFFWSCSTACGILVPWPVIKQVLIGPPGKSPFLSSWNSLFHLILFVPGLSVTMTMMIMTIENSYRSWSSSHALGAVLVLYQASHWIFVTTPYSKWYHPHFRDVPSNIVAAVIILSVWIAPWHPSLSPVSPFLAYECADGTVHSTCPKCSYSLVSPFHLHNPMRQTMSLFISMR